MTRLVHRLLWTAALCGALLGASTAARAEPGSSLHAAAANEGVVRIYAATDENVVRPLIDDFEQRYPGVRVEFEDMGSRELYRRFLDEVRDGGRVDVMWSSAVDLQVKLVNDGHAQRHRSAQTTALPSWAVWKDEAFGTTFEPIAIVYNRRLLEPNEVPATHAELLRLLERNRARFEGRLTSYDPAVSGLGFMLHSQDEQANPVVFWKLAEAFGHTGIVTLPTSGAMLDRIASGDALLGYNLLGSYALLRAERDPDIGVVLPRDYTLVLTRVAFIARQAPHPNAARLWLDYLLSGRGQHLLARNPGFFSVRDDVRGDPAAQQLRDELGNSFRPIAIGAGLMTYLDQAKRNKFLRRWHETLYPLP